MFSKVLVPFLVLLSFFGILATAAPQTTSQCNTGSAQCCITVAQAGTLPGLSLLTGLLGIVIGDLETVVGIGCSAIVLGQGANCAQQPVCCQNNNFEGLLNIGCSPISL